MFAFGRVDIICDPGHHVDHPGDDQDHRNPDQRILYLSHDGSLLPLMGEAHRGGGVSVNRHAFRGLLRAVKFTVSEE